MADKDKNTSKLCRIINDRFSFILEVDGQSIPFNGSWNAEYFKEHYLKLGYTIIKIDNMKPRRGLK